MRKLDEAFDNRGLALLGLLDAAQDEAASAADVAAVLYGVLAEVFGARWQTKPKWQPDYVDPVGAKLPDPP